MNAISRMMMKLRLGVLLAGLCCSASLLKAQSKDFLLSIPIVTYMSEAVTRAELNIKNKFSLSLDWTVVSPQEYLFKRELAESPGSSLLVKGQEIAAMVQFYKNPKLMSGFLWGLGFGYRTETADWRKDPHPQDLRELSLRDDAGKVQHYLKLSGVTALAKVGYRFVSESLGAAFGICLNVRHFESQVLDLPKKSNYHFSVGANDRESLRRRMMTRILPGIEFGWAF